MPNDSRRLYYNYYYSTLRKETKGACPHFPKDKKRQKGPVPNFHQFLGPVPIFQKETKGACPHFSKETKETKETNVHKGPEIKGACPYFCCPYLTEKDKRGLSPFFNKVEIKERDKRRKGACPHFSFFRACPQFSQFFIC